jgi:hypothetical protein
LSTTRSPFTSSLYGKAGARAHPCPAPAGFFVFALPDSLLLHHSKR